MIEIKLLDNELNPPEYATPGSAAIDLRSRKDVVLYPGVVEMIGTGIAIHIDNRNIVAKLYARSGFAKYGVTLANGVGVIDSDYTGEICALMINHGKDVFKIEKGDRIAQLAFEKVMHPRMAAVDEFTVTSARGSKGFGSSGVK